MKKKVMLIATVALIAAFSFLKARASEDGTLSHYCQLVEETPGHIQTACIGDAKACGTVSDCLSN